MKRILLTATLGLLAANAVAETEEHDYSIGTGEGILVCVFDGSVNTHHKALRDAKIDGIHDISIGQYDRASSASDHGTTMASLMLKHAPQADYFYIPGFGPNLTGNQQNEKFKTAIEVCLNKGADIISIPGGTPSYDVEVERLMLKARNAGALVLAAAGNHGKPGQETVYHQYPASYPTTLSIGAVGMSESAGIIPWEHSAVNPRLDLVALGVDLPSALTSEDGQSFYGVSSGTSQATAISAGLIAQVWSNHRDCNADNIYSVMKSTALEYPEQRFGSGFIDVKAADNALSKHGCSGGLDATTDEWYYLEAYDGGDEVAYKGDIYLAKHWTKNEEPGLSDVWIATGETQEFDENKILNRYNLNSVKNQVHYVPSAMSCSDSAGRSDCTVTIKCNDWTLNCGRGNVNLGTSVGNIVGKISKKGTQKNNNKNSKDSNLSKNDSNDLKGLQQSLKILYEAFRKTKNVDLKNDLLDKISSIRERIKSIQMKANSRLKKADDDVDNYENPGHHDPSGYGPNNYNRNKAVLPKNHRQLFKDSKQVGKNRWTKEGFGKKAVYHRFSSDGNGKYHWSGSTNGKTSNGTSRSIKIKDVPSTIRRGEATTGTRG